MFCNANFDLTQRSSHVSKFYHNLTPRICSSHKIFKTRIRGSFKIGEPANTGLNTPPPYYIFLRRLKKLPPFALFITKIYKTCLPSYPKNHIGMEEGKYGGRGEQGGVEREKVK
jgi:hypothetical protein